MPHALTEERALDVSGNPLVVCAWCDREAGGSSARGRVGLVSHGICRRHVAEMLAEAGLAVEQRGEFRVVTKAVKPERKETV